MQDENMRVRLKTENRFKERLEKKRETWDELKRKKKVKWKRG